MNSKEQYNGPEFDEYCINEGKYLPATRDRTTCLSCPLNDLCQAGFDEQIRLLRAGEPASLTEGRHFAPAVLKPDKLLDGLTEAQKKFIVMKIPSLAVTEKESL